MTRKKNCDDAKGRNTGIWRGESHQSSYVHPLNPLQPWKAKKKQKLRYENKICSYRSVSSIYIYSIYILYI